MRVCSVFAGPCWMIWGHFGSDFGVFFGRFGGFGAILGSILYSFGIHFGSWGSLALPGAHLGAPGAPLGAQGRKSDEKHGSFPPARGPIWESFFTNFCFFFGAFFRCVLEEDPVHNFLDFGSQNGTPRGSFWKDF